MWRWRNRAPYGGRAAFAGVVAVAGMLASISNASADPGKATWFPGFSTIVVDAKTGSVINATKADELRHPASLTKIMTLYMLFAELEAGRLKLGSRIRISAEAAGQPPSKLGLNAGDSIVVEDAIKAIITRSANDVAVAVAEIIAGDEDSFAKLMTRRARAIGMTRSVFKNASGLPDPEQVTTARDMALLGLALQDRFPSYYPYFATRAFQWRGVTIGNHNRLLGSVDGVDGIKTGYTRASGFNLVSNVKRGGRHVVAVVLGGQTGAARDALMRDLIAENIRHASAGPRTAPRFAETAMPPSASAPAPITTAAIRPNEPAPGSRDPVTRTPVRVTPVGKDGERPAERPKSLGVLPVSNLSANSIKVPVQITPMALAPEGKVVTFAPPPPPSSVATASAQESPEIERAKVVSALVPETAPEVLKPEENPAARGGWIIQIGAYANEQQARERLAEARARAASVLAKSSPYAEKATKGRGEFYRARFAGFDEASAKHACETLKKNDFSCFAAKN
jgi:D-alanyl-D-alanine carboxypeptidase